MSFVCRKNFRGRNSGDQENTEQRGQPSEKPTDPRSESVADETNENIPASSEEPSGLEQLSHEECSPSPQLVSRPLSPSRYMRRLPPPPGFYLTKEHNYAQLSPLLWRRRYNQAIDCLEKALRQLHAARRRENRLRSTVMRLRDKRLKQALVMPQDGCKNRGSWTPDGEKRQGKERCNQEECEIDAKAEDTGLFEDRCLNQMKLGGHFLPDTDSWSEEEKGYCFYCGRGQVQVGGRVAHRVSKTRRDAKQTVENSVEIERNVKTNTCSTAENAKDIQMERPLGKSVENNDSVVKNSVLLQTQGIQHLSPAEVSLTDVHEQSLQYLCSQQKLLLSDMCEGDTEATGQEHHTDLQQHLFLIQNSAEGQVILVPVPAGNGLQGLFKMEGVPDKAQTILVSEADLQEAMGHMAEKNRDLCKLQTVCDGEYTDQHPVTNTTSVEIREDVREKLKQHLEGFHLQLSTEFLN